jgi:hypothetical protein
MVPGALSTWLRGPRRNFANLSNEAPRGRGATDQEYSIMQTTSETPQAEQTAIRTDGNVATSPVEFIELGLGLEMLLETHPVFSDAVKAALLPLDGEFLFELPLAERPDGKGRIAAVRLAYEGADDRRLAFAVLSDDGLETSVHTPDAQPEHLKSFAESFVDVLQRLEKIAAH